VTAPALLTVQETIAAAERIAAAELTSNRATSGPDASQRVVRSMAVLVGQLHAVALLAACNIQAVLSDTPEGDAAAPHYWETLTERLVALGYLVPPPTDPEPQPEVPA
jgi:hypothetical protein